VKVPRLRRRQKGCRAPILNHHFRDLADKHIVLDNQYHGHHNSFGRDNKKHSAALEPFLPYQRLCTTP